MTDEAETIGQAIRRARTERGLSQLTLAVRAGVDPGTVSRAERGAIMLNTATLIQIAAALEMPLDELTGRARDAAPGREPYPSLAAFLARVATTEAERRWLLSQDFGDSPPDDLGWTMLLMSFRGVTATARATVTGSSDD